MARSTRTLLRLPLGAGLVGGWLLAAGCAYPLMMRKAETLASKGDWAGAYAAYTKAAERRPDDAEARAGQQEAREKVVAEAIEAANAALARSDYEGTMAELARAETFDADAPEVYKVKDRTLTAMREELIRDWESGDARATYALAVRTRKLFPTADFLAATFDQLRSHYTTRAVELLRGKKFDVSLAAVRTIVEFEPEQKATMAPLEAKILETWADDLVAKAVVHEKAKRLGAAAALYAHAHELAGRATDLSKARLAAEKLGATAKVTVKLDVTGVPTRAAALKNAITTGVAAIPDVAMTALAAPPPLLTVKVTAPAPKCTESDTVTKAEQDYISGQVQKPNPDYTAASAALTAARSDETKAKAASEKLWPQLQAAQAQADRAEAALKEAERKQAEAETSYDAAAEQLAAAKIKRDDAEVEIDKQRLAGAGDAALAALEAQQAELALRVSEWSGEVIAREEAEGRARRELAKVIAARDPVVATRDALKAQYESLVLQRTTAQTLAGDLTTKLASTPKTVTEDVHATLSYDVHDWVRTCTAPASIGMATKWTTTLPKAKTVTPSERSQDRSHIGHVKAGLTEDVKKFPQTDAELVAHSDTETSAAIVTWATALVDDAFRDRVARARTGLASSSPSEAANTVVSLYVGAPSRIDPDSLAVFQAALKDAYGLEKMELLRPAP